MKARQVKSLKSAREIVEAREIHHIKVGVFDIDGVLRGKYISRAKFLSALEKGFGFCDVVLGWDSNDQLYDNVSFTGWHSGYPDATARLLPETCRELPHEENTLLFLGEFSGNAEKICPRSLLRRMVEKARSMGFEPFGSAEYEFFVFNETPESIREKGYRDLKPITPGNFGYSLLRASVWSEFYEGLLAISEKMDFPIEGLHTETGPGVLEAAITVDRLLESADRAALFKTYTKIMAQRNDLMATFMARWSRDYPGQSGHLHLSLQDDSGRPVFYDPEEEHGISQTMRHFIGGCQHLMPETLALIAPTINAYRRLVPGFWAPTHATWGIENRTCALRIVHGSAMSQRVEYRVAAADANPYLALATALACGLYGIENKIEPGDAVEGNAYALDPVLLTEKLAPFPATLWDAAQALRSSTAARSLFGDDFVDHFAATREWEEREFRKYVSDWELQRYFEII